MVSHSNNQHNGQENGKKRPYVTPKMISEDLFESKGLACSKLSNGIPGVDCSMIFGPGSTSAS